MNKFDITISAIIEITEGVIKVVTFGRVVPDWSLDYMYRATIRSVARERGTRPTKSEDAILRSAGFHRRGNLYTRGENERVIKINDESPYFIVDTNDKYINCLPSRLELCLRGTENGQTSP